MKFVEFHTIEDQIPYVAGSTISDENCAIFRKFCEDKNAHYYCEEKHEFSLWAAENQALNAGKTLVIYENLS